jgi:ABC-type oligopeptide transport system substrate-binding subunit
VGRMLWLSLAMFAAGAALLAAAGFANPAGSGPNTSLTEQAKRGGTLRLSRFSDVDYVDPALAYSPWANNLEFATCAKLFNYPDKAGAAGTRVFPEVVRRFRVSKNGRTYTFELKKTFRFHTGDAVTARSFADAFNRDANPSMQSPATRFMHEIVGADAVIEGRAKTISGVRVLGRYRLRIALTKPLGDFTTRLTMPFFCPLLPNTRIEPAGINDPPGSGPYYVAERVVNRRIVLKRNPFYRGGRPANVDQVVWTIGESPEACRLATEQDRIDYCVINAVPLSAYRELADKYGINRKGGRFFRNTVLSTSFFAFNHDRPAFRGRGQIPLKKAINYAIDRPALARTFGYLGGRRTDQMLPPALGRDESIYPIRGADPAAAMKWLGRARFKPKKLVLYANSRGPAVAEAFAFDLKQIGIDVDVKYFDLFQMIERTGTRGEPYDIVQNGWLADYADAVSYFETLLNGRNLRATGNSNTSYFDEPRVNARIATANRLTGEARRQAWANLDVDLMRNDPPWAPFVHGTGRDFVSPSFGCYLFQPVYQLDIAAACKK